MKVDTELKKDRDLYHRDERVDGVVNLLLQDKTNTCSEVISLVNSSYTCNEFYEKIGKIFQFLSDDENAVVEFCKYYPHLENIYKDINKCSNLRGALLERYVYKILKEKYENYSILHISCYVIIKTIETWKSDKSVDVLYYSEDKHEGETFECKVNPFGIEREHIENLKEIYINSDHEIKPRIACFTSREAIELEIKDKKILPGVVELVGFKDLKMCTPRYKN